MLISLNMLETLFLKPRRLETRAGVEGGAAERLESPKRRKGADSFLNENTLSLIIAPSRALKRGERRLFFSFFQKRRDGGGVPNRRALPAFAISPILSSTANGGVYFVGVGRPISRIRSCKSAQASFLAGGLRNKYAGW